MARFNHKPSPTEVLPHRWTFCDKPSPTCLLHYGVKGMKWGVRRTPEQLGHKPKKTVAKTDKPGIIKVTVSGHQSIPKCSTPNSILDYLDANGRVKNRSFYGEDGMKAKEIHMTPHGNSKEHALVPHAHDYTWLPETDRSIRTTRDLTDTERKENEDIL